MRNSLLGVSVQLSTTKEGDGGFCILRGSHKSNFPCPVGFAQFLSDGAKDHIFQPATKAGDVVLFSEATTHGTLPWTCKEERRVALYRLAPNGSAYGRAYLNWPKQFLEGMTETQLAVMQPPYGVRLDRQVLSVSREGETVVSGGSPRSNSKKEFDQKLFGTSYF